MLRFLADVRHETLQRDLDREVVMTMKKAGYIDLVGAVVEESIKPLAEWLTKLDPSKLSNEHRAMYRLSFTSNLKALERQAEN